MAQMFFPQIQQAPGPDFRKVRKSLKSIYKLFAYLKILHDILSADVFLINVFKIFFKQFNTIRVSNRLDLDQTGHFVEPDLNPNCL